uniref:Reverse transcriptase domain-containing protein n=1 Tax=Tanacetum cinerariifolium TaxID=118510 RepID=A0A6L2P5I0_TANCI|nr:reverse transcriptase domain-containing protein [Tanacetum cinerariifolium]
MRSRSSSNLVGESSPNPTTSNSKYRNRRRSNQTFILEESPLDTMADQRTMAELLRAPTEGYAEAIVVPPILAEHFELKHSLINMMTSDQFFELEKDNPHDHISWFNKITSTKKYKDVPNSTIKLMLFPFSLVWAARHWLEKEPPRSILTWEDIVSKFINEFFPPSRTTNLLNEISNFQQRFDESFHEAWDRYKDLLPDQDSLNSASVGNLLERRTQDVLTIIENKSKVYNSRNKSIASQVKSSDANSSSSSEIAKLTHAVNQQTSVVTTTMTAILKQFQATPPLASVKAVEDICVTCGGAHPYYQFLAGDGNTFSEFQDNIQGYVSAAAVNYNQAVILKKLPEKLRDLGKFLIPCGFSELKCKDLADLGVSINLTPLSVWKKIGLPELISTRMTLELANMEICTLAGIARDVFVPIRKFTFPTDFVIVDYESDPRVSLILERPFLWTLFALIEVHGEEMILRDGDERLTLNMRHDTSSYSNQPHKESINMINIYNDSYEDYLEDFFAINHLSGNPNFSSHTDLTSPEVINPLSGNTTSSSPEHLLEEFADELALITLPPGNDDLPFDIESNFREIEYLPNHDPTKEMDSILKDSVDECNLADHNNNLVDTIPEMFTDEHTLNYSSPSLYDDVDDDLVELESNNDDVYDDLFDSKEDKIKESKLLIDELDPPRSSDFLPSLEYDSVLYEDFSKVDALPSTNNEDKVFNSGILIYENLFEVTIRETPDKNVKKISISNASLILENFNPPLYELPFHKEVPRTETLLSFSAENEEKVFNPWILTSKGVHTSLLSELSHRGPKAFKVIKIFKSPMEIFPCSYREDIRILNVDSPLLGVNTPRSDEDRLKLMEFMVFLLQKGKSDAAEGFEQIIDFLNGSYIHYALTMNPYIYVSCIKQFWNTASVKLSDDVTRLQALVGRKKIVISEDVIHEILQLDNAKGVVCLPNEEICAGLAQTGYEKPTSWNETPLFEGMIAAREVVEEEIAEEQVQADDAVAATVQETDAEDVANEAIPSTPTPLILPSTPSHDIPSTTQVQSLPLQQPQSTPQALPQGAEFPTHLFQQLEIIKLKARVKRLEKANKVKSSKLRRLKKVGTSHQVVSSDDMEDVFNQGRMIDDLDKDEGIELVVDQVKDADIAETEGRHAANQAKKQAEIYHLDLDHPFKVLSMQEDDSEVQEVVEVVTTAKLITEVVTVATSQVSAASATIFAAKPSIPAPAPTGVAAYTRRRKGVIIRDPKKELSSKTPAETPKLKDKGKGILIETPKPTKKKNQIELDVEYARKLHEEINKDHEEINKDIDWDAAIDHVKQKSKENPQYIKRYQVMKKRPQTESEACKNMMIYLKNTAGYKLDFFKGMSYDEICPIFQARFDAIMRFLFKSREEIEEEDQEVLKSINETPAQKAAKRRKLDEEAQEAKDLKKNLEVVNDEDDDVFIESTPLARKVNIKFKGGLLGSKIHSDVRQEGKEKVFDQEYILLPVLNTISYVPSSNEEVESSPKDDAGKKLIVEPTCIEGGKIVDLGCLDQQMKSTEDSENTNSANSFNTASPTVNTASDKDGTF